MVSRLTGQLLQKMCHFNSSQTFSPGVHPSQTVHTLGILSFVKNKLPDFSGLGKVMSKRTAVETFCISPISKKQNLAAAEDWVAEEETEIDHMSTRRSIWECGGCAETDCVLNLVESSVSPTGKDDSSATGAVADSGTEITPSDRALAGRPHVPGFLLVERKSFPAPNFDVASSSPSPPCVEAMPGSDTPDTNPVTHWIEKKPKGKTVAVMDMGNCAKPDFQTGAVDTKLNSQPSALKRPTVVTEKRHGAPSGDCHAKHASKKRAAGQVLMSCPKQAAAPGRDKGTVLPAALLKQVVQAVRGNVRAISTQVVAASATKLSSAPGTLQAKHEPSRDKLGKVDKGMLSDPAWAGVETESGGCCSLSAGSGAAAGSDATSGCDAGGSGDGKREFEKQKVVVQKGTSERSTDDALTLATKGVRPSAPETSRQRSLGSSYTQACGDEPDLSEVADKSTEASGEGRKHDITVDLSAVLPVECVEREAATSSDRSKKRKKGKKKRQHGGQRLSGGGDGESLLDVLPVGVLDMDGQVNSRSKDHVYNLSPLFSGRLGDGSTPRQKVRPNYFLAIQITSPEIKAGLSRVHKAVEEEEAGLRPAFVSVDKAHLTLAVMHLPDEEAINRAKAALDEFKMLQEQARQKQQLRQQQPQQQQPQQLEQQQPEQQQPEQQQPEQQQPEQQQPEQQQLKQQQAQEEGKEAGGGDPLTLEVKGLGHFRHTVVFAKVTEGEALERLHTIAASVRACVEKQNISLVSAFVPHITVMKMSKNRGKLLGAGLKKVDPQLYQAACSWCFGRQTVATIQLCSMTKPMHNGYYYIEHEVPF